MNDGVGPMAPAATTPPSASRTYTVPGGPALTPRLTRRLTGVAMV